MNILVCLKMVSQSTYTDAIGNNKNADRLSDGQLVINPADAYALELALRMKDKDKTIKITAIMMAPQYAEHILRTALSMGADQAVHVSDQLFAGADTIATAETLARAITLLPSQDLILCGNKAIDSETGHIGPQLAVLLSLPAITNVIDMDRDGDTLLLQRSQEDGIAIYCGRLPLLLTVVNGSRMVRSPTILGMRRSKNAPIRLIDGAALGLSEEFAGQKASGTETIQVKQLQFPHRHGQRLEDPVLGAEALALLLRGGREIG